MARNPAPRRRQKPQRTCVACRQVQDKQALIRLVAHPTGAAVDPGATRAGRGAYLHARAACWQAGLGLTATGAGKRRRTPLEQALRVTLSDEARRDLAAYLPVLEGGPEAARAAATSASEDRQRERANGRIP